MLIRISRSCTVLLITAVFTLLASKTAATAAGRSILLVILDDFGMDKATFFPVGAYRKATKLAAAAMPNLTRMAQGGVRFGNTGAAGMLADAGHDPHRPVRLPPHQRRRR